MYSQREVYLHTEDKLGRGHLLKHQARQAHQGGLGNLGDPGGQGERGGVRRAGPSQPFPPHQEILILHPNPPAKSPKLKMVYEDTLDTYR